VARGWKNERKNNLRKGKDRPARVRGLSRKKRSVRVNSPSFAGGLLQLDLGASGLELFFDVSVRPSERSP